MGRIGGMGNCVSNGTLGVLLWGGVTEQMWIKLEVWVIVLVMKLLVSR